MWQVRWLQGETEVCSTFDAQMKQTSPSSASSVAAATCFVPTVAVFNGGCVSLFRDPTVLCSLSRPPEPLPPRPRDREPLLAPSLEL